MDWGDVNSRFLGSVYVGPHNENKNAENTYRTGKCTFIKVGDLKVILCYTCDNALRNRA